MNFLKICKINSFCCMLLLKCLLSYCDDYHIQPVPLINMILAEQHKIIEKKQDSRKQAGELKHTFEIVKPYMRTNTANKSTLTTMYSMNINNNHVPYDDDYDDEISFMDHMEMDNMKEIDYLHRSKEKYREKPVLINPTSKIKVWGAWSHWSPCNLIAGFQQRFRLRRCISGACSKGEAEAQYINCK